MLTVDAFTREIIKHKICAAVDEGAVALESAAGTMVVAEAHDFIIALFTPEGELLYTWVGILQHVACAAKAVKSVIDYFAGDVFEDDVYMFNDPYKGALHSPDVFIITPVHFQGKLVAWVASFTHIPDTGAIDPGGFCTSATECYHEGFQTAGLKLIEKGKYRRDVWDTFVNMTRLPELVAMDVRSQIAAGFVAKQRMIKLYMDYGHETVEVVGKGLIEESDRLFGERLLEIPDGIYRTRKYLDMPEKVYTIELALIKEKDTLTYDFTGTSEQSVKSINATIWGTRGAIFSPIFTLVCPDLTWNEGILRHVKVIAPQGTLVNCRKPAPTSLCSISVLFMVNSVSTQVVSKMLGANEKFKNRVTADWPGAAIVWVVFGLMPDGEYITAINTESFIGSGGSRAFKDGVDCGGELLCLTSRVANMETWELRTPVRYLYRRVVPDSGGPGKYRGGCATECAQTPHGSPDNKFHLLALPGVGTFVPTALGCSGGLPGCTVEWTQFREGNVSEHPADRSSTKGKREEHINFGLTDIVGNDIVYIRQSGGGGYGDPLDRDPDLVLNDVLQGLVTIGPSRDIYGVVIDLDNKRVDVEATRERRLTLRKERLGGKELEVDTSKRIDVPPNGRRINEYLQVAGSGEESFVQCTWCGRKVCPANARWKDNVATQKVSIASAGPGRKHSDLFSMLQFFCPACATQFDVDIVYKDDPPPYDEIY